MSDSKSNVQRLQAAGVIGNGPIADHHAEKINSLSEDEVNTLVNLRKKMGSSDEVDDHLRPNFFV